MSAQDPRFCLEVRTRAELRDWLAEHFRQRESIWLVTRRKGRAKEHAGEHVAYAAIVEEALCFGWIDSLPRRLDDDRTMVLLSPRRPRSGWSAVNKARVERLTAEGLMTEPGLAVVARAKADGSWSVLDAASALDVPADLAAALDAVGARETFDAFPRSARRSILEWITLGKRRETRAARIAETARAAARGERARTWRAGGGAR